jgi:hypothetical protein
MILIHLSPGLEPGVASALNDEIHVFTQFFVHRDPRRNLEIRECLRRNVANPHITRIHLLNERIYTSGELGGGQCIEKVIQTQTPGQRRLTYQDVFHYVEKHQIQGFLVLTNADIFFDATLDQIRHGQLHEKRQMMALLRYEFNGASTATSPIFGPRFDSQDTWIFHSNFVPSKGVVASKAFAFEFGKPGCDNKMVYLARILGYDVINDPRVVRTYHYHQTALRDYQTKDTISQPWGVCVPHDYDAIRMPTSLGIQQSKVYEHTGGFQYLVFEDNRVLHDYLAAALAAGRPFVVPRVAGIENNVAVFGRMTKMGQGTQEHAKYFQQIMPTMKNNAGVVLSNITAVIQYSDLYLAAFDQCEMFTGWDVQGNCIGHIAHSYAYIQQTYERAPEVERRKRPVWALALDVFHYLHDTPWTWALRGQRILLISPLEESLRAKVPIRDQLWGDTGIDLFPDCTFVYVRPPMTQGTEPARDFDTEFTEFCQRLDAVRDQYDVALVGCGGYGNPVCGYIHATHGKSAIYVGGVLQMYFGILGGRWLKERPDVVRLYMNAHWSRPDASERPKGCEGIEQACYW